jgi:iron complex outermembrane recepter protein
VKTVRATHWRASLSFLAMAVATGVPALAQDKVEEIVVTATKREEKLSDVPISIGVVGGDTVDKLHLEDLRDLQSYVPNFSVQSTFGNWAVQVRGLGSGVANLAFDSSVSIFNDGIYCGRSRCLEGAFLDVERVEVARGPQGALFGKSTIAGALSITSAKPTEEFESYLRSGYEFENGGYFVTAMASGPILEGLRARIVGNWEEVGGWVNNPIIHTDEPNSDRWAVRGSVEWDITDSLMAALKVEHFDAEVDGNTNQLVNGQGTFAALTADPVREFERNTTRRVSTATSDEDFDNSDSTGVTFTLDQTFAEHTLNLTVGHWQIDYANWLDVDGVPEGFLNTGLSETFDQQSVEMRLVSPAGRMFDYIVGGLFYTSDTKTRQHSPFGFFPLVVAPVPVGSDRNFERDTDTYSFYGQLTWNATEDFRVIGDLRFTREKQHGLGYSFPVSYPDRRNPVYTPGAFAQPPEYVFRQLRDDDAVDPSLRIQYDVNEDFMVYGSWGTGSKPGGLKANDGTLGTQLLAKNTDPAYLQRYIGQPSITPAQMAAGVTLREGNHIFDFEDEQATTLEVGAKMGFLDGRISLNAAAFFTEFKDLQTSTYDGTRFIIKNAAAAEVRGIELDGLWYATDELRFAATFGYLNHNYSEFPGGQCVVIDENGTFRDPGCVDGFQDLSGMPLTRTPDWEGTVSVDWDWPIGSRLLLSTNLTMNYSDSYDVREDYHPLGQQSAYQKWDTRVALGSPEDTWQIALLARNLGDEHVIQHAYEIAGGNFVSFSNGRTITLEGTYRFK